MNFRSTYHKGNDLPKKFNIMAPDDLVIQGARTVADMVFQLVQIEYSIAAEGKVGKNGPKGMIYRTDILTPCGLVTSYGNIDLGQH